MLDNKPLPEPFDINRRPETAKAGAQLPMLGVTPRTSMDMQFPISCVDEYLAALHSSIGDTASIVRSNIMEAAKALGAEVPQAFSYSQMSFLPDPANHGLMNWPGLNPESLRKIVRENIAPQLIIRSRVSDIARYSGLSTHPWKPGWRITLMEASKSPSSQDKKDIRDAERFIWNCSREAQYTDARERDTQLIAPFEMFMRSFADDALTFDAHAIWTDMDARGGVRAFCNLPSGMIRLALPTKGYRGDRRLFCCLIDDTGNPVKPFTRQELTWRIRNVRLDPAIAGYGWPEPEIAARLIQGFQAGIDLNIDTFTKNSIPNGMLLLKGDYFQQDQIDALMREWTNMKRGLSKLWGLPVMGIPADSDVELMQFMDLKGDDVRYHNHLNMMAAMCCTVWNFPVKRLGMFASGNRKDNEPQSGGSIELQGTDDGGLPAILEHLEATINPYLLWSNWPHLKFEFLNKNPTEDARSYEARKLARTWGEARAEADLPKLESLAPAHLKPLAEIMALSPEDPAKQSSFQTMAVVMLQEELGLNDEPDPASPGAPMSSKKDPAKSLKHGHGSGVRRDSKAEGGKS
jgi:hypothetical protein